ncbi:MAG TPA: serine/threonine-protein kinase [Sphingobacteriaceae bacterium]|nr:serine/threonine-protein kinase [Sphingobacteriaceae bacterium]
MGKVFTITEGLENMGALRTGGQGSVYRGRRMGEIFSAVKLLPTPIHTESDEDKNFRDFQNEVTKLSKVNEQPNPHVVKIINSGLTDSGGFPFIEMEYIEGHDLEDLIKEPFDSVFTVKEIKKLADQLSNALAHCHKVGVKHGDVKSNNVKFNIHSCNYILLDFGLSIMSDEQRRTSLRHAGAIEFMAPEQSEGAMLFETDVYSFGIILYELLAGRVPFPLVSSGETARNTIMISHMETPVPDLISLRKENLPVGWSDEKKAQEMQVPKWLLSVISKCLEKRPENRYKNGMDLHKAIIMNGILAMKGDDGPINSASSLQHENVRLHTLVMQYQQNINDKERQLSSIKESILSRDAEIEGLKTGLGAHIHHNKVRLPKAAFLALLIMLVTLSAFSGYAILSDKKDNTTTANATRTLHADTISNNQIKNSDTVPPVKVAKHISVKKEVPVPVISEKQARKNVREARKEERRRKRATGTSGKLFEVKIY